MSSSAIFVLDVKGKVLISRNYRGDMDLSCIDKFMPLLMEREEEGEFYRINENSGAAYVLLILTDPNVFPVQASSLPSSSPGRAPSPT